MIYKESKLPTFPCEFDLWDKLASETRPIVVYGMGNGADKLIQRFEKYGIEIDDFFASDGFVRGHFFHGKRVKSLDEIKSLYSDFVIVLSFASNRDEVIGLFIDLDKKYDLYIPDMPVTGEEYFDKDFFNNNYNSICKAYESLSDENSKNAFANIVNFKLFGRLTYLESAYSTKEELYSFLQKKKFETIIDAGAYNGDTLKDVKSFFTNLKKAYAVEPDVKTFKRLRKYCEAEKDFQAIAINSAVWSSTGETTFLRSGNRNSSISSTASHEHQDDVVSMIKVDDLTEEKVDYIKYDVEGAELEALIGSDCTILKHKPVLLVSAYHRSEDVFSLVNYLHEKYDFYNLYFLRLRAVPAWEIDIIAIPK